MAKTDREKAQARVIKWKRLLFKGQDIAKHADIYDGDVSKILNGKGYVPSTAIQKVLDAEEMKV